MIDDGFNTHFFMFGKESEHLSRRASSVERRATRERESGNERRGNERRTRKRTSRERRVINHSLVTAAAEETRGERRNEFPRPSPSAAGVPLSGSHNLPPTGIPALVAATASRCPQPFRSLSPRDASIPTIHRLPSLSLSLSPRDSPSLHSQTTADPSRASRHRNRSHERERVLVAALI